MNKKLTTILVVLLGFTLITCEKDDICTDDTTPNLIIEFYKQGVTTPTLKPVTKLKINVTNFSDLAFDGVSKISIPLKTSVNETTFNFTLNGSDTDTSDDNLDVLKFSYTREDEFVSGACGYKTNFYTLEKNLTTDADNWIKAITIIQPTIENEDETHIKIYF
jgi:hypothetical protein